MVDTPELAAEIVAAVNAARDAADGRPDAELERLRRLERSIQGAVWVAPGRMSGQACVGGHRVTARQVAGLVPDVGEEGVAHYYPGVTPYGAAAAVYFCDRYVDRYDRERGEVDPRTEVEAHWGGDPEQIVSAWEQDRAELKAELDRLDTALAEARTEHRDALDSLQRTQAVAEHWRAAAVTWPEPMNTAAHPLNLVLDAARGETDPQMLGMSADDLADGVLAVRRAAREEGQ
ncbi:hypothetical protein GCM10023224_05260 [Streptomonospora halophila]|uniref:Uncharacterized protein n=2 Tax=Streptomonospora halophila TaxID=427369 RepID=A0ABP9G5X6_9ACTN